MSNRTAARQIWKIDNQRVVLGDCLAVMRSVQSSSIDVIETSPPYNIGASYHQHDDRQPRDRYLGFLAEVFAEAHRVLKPGGSFFLNLGTGTQADPWLPYDVISAARAAGFVLQNEIEWIKAVAVDGVIRGHLKPVNSEKYLDRAHEKILHLTKRGDVDLDKLAIGVPFADKSNLGRHNKSRTDTSIPKPDLRCGTNVWPMFYITVQLRTEKFDHPAGFPVELPTRCIRLHGVHPGLVVMDPFLGTGTTLVAAQALGCQGIGIEIDPVYAETAVRRLSANGAS
jgi:site-specific DNA-methyltransferase (adenine-specific)